MCASFCVGTRILTNRGRVRVEKLRLGEEVITPLHGPMPIRWIGHRIYGRHFARLNPNTVPVMVQAGAIEDGIPSRNLYISPLHNLFIEGILIPVGELVNGSSVVRCEQMDPIDYYNLELPVHSIVLAEDLPAESYVDRDDRAMFTSTSSVGQSDWAEQAPTWKACAPVAQPGPMIERVRARLALRAGITPPSIMDRPQTGPLLGKVEWAGRSMISGWAWLLDHPTVPVVLEVLNKGDVIAVSVADRFRADLRRAGIGDVHHAFHVELPRLLSPTQSHELTIRRAADGLALLGCPLALPASRPSTALAELDLAALINDADPAETRRVLDWLEQQSLKLRARLIAAEAPPPPPLTDRVEDIPLLSERRLRRIKGPKVVHM